MKFKDEMVSRGWWLRAGAHMPATHLLLDGGRLCVPDDHAGTFLNLYFNAILRRERVSVVELKTPIFRLFFDIDARVATASDAEHADHETFTRVFESIYAAVHEFWAINGGVRMLVCAAPPKPQDNEHTKLGFHVVFPTIYVNAPIALAFRDTLLKLLDETCAGICVNPWSDAIDPCVFKANGLRALYSSKGPHEDRAYVPWGVVERHDNTAETALDQGIARVGSLTAPEKREWVHECSLRVFNATLTPCVGGQDTIADQPDVHRAGGVVIGRSVALDAYTEWLPKVQEALPAVYATQRFIGVFKTESAVMLRSSSRYCQHVGREHRTSTVYFCITRRGVCQKCYCRKDHGCAQYSSDHYPLSDEVITAFVPDALKCKVVPDVEFVARRMPSKKRSTSSLDTLLSRSRFLQPVQKGKKKPKK